MERTNIEKQIGKRLKDIRLLKRLSQEKVAKHCNVSFQQIQKYEKGTNGLSVFRLLQLCNGLGVSFSYFVDGLDNGLKNFDGYSEVHQDQVSESKPVGQTSQM